MDYRNRKYFLLAFDGNMYNYRVQNLKKIIPSIKFFSPYNHFKDGEIYYQDYKINCDKYYDGFITNKMNKPGYWQIMISCKNEDEDALLYELKKAKRRDSFSCIWFELTKDICGQ